MKKVVELGLIRSSKNASPVFSNYPINWLLMYSDLRSFGYNPYAPEFSTLIREGKANKQYWKLMGKVVDFITLKKIYLGRYVSQHMSWLGLRDEDLKITRPSRRDWPDFVYQDWASRASGPVLRAAPLMLCDDVLNRAAAPVDPGLLESLLDILGADAVVADADAIERSTRTCLPFRRLASVVVYPATAEQVQRVVKAAGRFDVPIWAVSTGKNWGYGEKTAVYEAGITMILARMDRILHVDEELGYAVIEPGVTYKQLNDHLKQTGSRLWADTAGSTQFASVMGNALDKGRGPHADGRPLRRAVRNGRRPRRRYACSRPAAVPPATTRFVTRTSGGWVRFSMASSHSRTWASSSRPASG